jgi:hypothetical protein
MLRTPIVLLILAAVVPAAAGDEPLPAPRALPPAPVMVVLPPVGYAPPMPYRPSRYQVWQYYGVNGAGQWVPRVIDGPHGAYYAYDGRPYYWVPMHTREYRAYFQTE